MRKLEQDMKTEAMVYKEEGDWGRLVGKQEEEHQLSPDTRKLDLATHLNTSQEGRDQLEGKGNRNECEQSTIILT